MPWRDSTATERKRCCCPFVEIALADRTNPARVVARFQTQRLEVTPMTNRNFDVGRDIGGAGCEFDETFTFKPRPREFWENLSLRFRVWDRDFVRDIPLGETVIPMANYLFSIGSEKRSYRTLESFVSTKGTVPPSPRALPPQLLVSVRFTKVVDPSSVVLRRGGAALPSPAVVKPPMMRCLRPGAMPKTAPGLVGQPVPRRTAQTSEGEPDVGPPRTRAAKPPGEEAPSDRAHHVWRHASKLNLARRVPRALGHGGGGPPHIASPSSSPRRRASLVTEEEKKLLLGALAADDPGTTELALRHTPLSPLEGVELFEALRARPNRHLLVLRLDGCFASSHHRHRHDGRVDNSSSSPAEALSRRQHLGQPGRPKEATSSGSGGGGDDWLKHLAARMAKDAPQFRDLSLKGCGAAVGDYGAELLAVVLAGGHPGLRRLDLSQCRVGRHGGRCIAAALQSGGARGGTSAPSFRELCLADNEMGPPGCAAICHALRANSTLLEVDISSNQMVRFRLHARPSASASGCRGSGPQEEGGGEGKGGPNFAALEHLSEAMRFNDTLERIALSRNSLCGLDEYGRGAPDVSALSAFCRALRLNTALREIELSGNPGAGGLKESFAISAPRVTFKCDDMKLLKAQPRH